MCITATLNTNFSKCALTAGRFRQLLSGRRRAAARMRAGGDSVRDRAGAARHHAGLRKHARQRGHRRARRAAILQLPRLRALVPMGWPCALERQLQGDEV